MKQSSKDRVYTDQSVASWPEYKIQDVICDCMSVKRKEIIPLVGKVSGIDDLVSCSGAGSVCTGCHPLLQELMGDKVWTPVEIVSIEQVSSVAKSFKLKSLDEPFKAADSPGPLNTGHEALACNECHEEADGSIRQQIQANLNYLLGAREKHVAFNYESPTNTDCLACHQRENDNHPIYRFNEPRFREAREALSPQHCVSCHQEHKGVRVTSAPDNCKHCHEELIVKEDPLDVSHQQLVDEKRWDTCLQCHDFHGGHVQTC
ncbi:hypothetical protein GQR58_023141 [Nymphon striatum]|nr:hypothetical protein GQR58_023141 [Nymphon striatum]